MKRVGILLGLLASLWLAGSASALTLRSGDGLTLTSAHQLDSRLWALSFTTSALPKPVNVDVLLPTGYASHPRRRYPVFYLLDGTSGYASDWTKLGAAEKSTAGRQLIVVMPDITLNGDGGGWCTDWPDGAENWETFHIGELLPWVQANLRTRNRRAERAIAGLSQGGFCSLSYAARHPDLFGIALGYSGAPEIYYDPQARAGAMAIINATEVGLDRIAPDTFFGDPFTDGINWAAHDPATLAENLRYTRMYMYWGNGANGPYDTGTVSPEANGIESAVNQDNIYFQTRLDALGIPAYFDDYGPGTHSWPYWARDLSWSIGKIMGDFAHPWRAPAETTYTSGDSAYSAYGWSVAMHRTARELSTLAHADARGFELAGSGSATVLTPPDYRAGARYAVSLLGPHADQALELVAGPDRRLRIEVPLGASNPYQQYSAQAAASGTAVYTTSATISPSS